MFQRKIRSSWIVVVVLAFASTTVDAKGLRLGQSQDAVPVTGSSLGEVSFLFSDLGTGPCAGFPPAQNPVTGELNNAQTVSMKEGWLSRVGWVAIDSAHCFNIKVDETGVPVLDEDGFPIFLSENGTIEIVTRNGDSIFGSYDGVQLTPGVPPSDGDQIINEGVIQIEGGTGRFEGAGGKLVYRVYVRVNFAGGWPIRYVISGLADL